MPQTERRQFCWRVYGKAKQYHIDKKESKNLDEFYPTRLYIELLSEGKNDNMSGP